MGAYFAEISVAKSPSSLDPTLATP
jgi:hypothetical protein